MLGRSGQNSDSSVDVMRFLKGMLPDVVVNGRDGHDLNRKMLQSLNMAVSV